MKKLCIYHGNCADGFGAAMAVYLKFGKNNVDFHAGAYQEDPPDVTGRDVIIVDFSYKRDVLLKMAALAKSILILDYHISAENDLVDLPGNVNAIFDMDRSGAVMAWEHFHPHEEIPRLYLHIQDRDLWQFKLDGTREITACIFSYPYDFPTWNTLMCADIKVLYNEGATLERKHYKDVNALIESSAYHTKIARYSVPIINAPFFMSSDIRHILSKNEPFAACYWDTAEGRVYSLRSANDGMDVSKIAAEFGGGGHKHAAGFRIPTELTWDNTYLEYGKLQ